MIPLISLIFVFDYHKDLSLPLKAYEREVRQREGRSIRRELSNVFVALRNTEASSSVDMDDTTATFTEKVKNNRKRITNQNKVAKRKGVTNGVNKNTTTRARSVKSKAQKGNVKKTPSAKVLKKKQMVSE